jgi:hypothetical protein
MDKIIQLDPLLIAGYVFIIFLTIIPLMSFFGHLASEEGRANLKASGLLMAYFPLYFGYFYLFWFRPDLVELVTGFARNGQMILYGILCCAPFIKSEPSM